MEEPVKIRCNRIVKDVRRAYVVEAAKITLERRRRRLYMVGYMDRDPSLPSMKSSRIE